MDGICLVDNRGRREGRGGAGGDGVYVKLLVLPFWMTGGQADRLTSRCAVADSEHSLRRSSLIKGGSSERLLCHSQASEEPLEDRQGSCPDHHDPTGGVWEFLRWS